MKNKKKKKGTLGSSQFSGNVPDELYDNWRKRNIMLQGLRSEGVYRVYLQSEHSVRNLYQAHLNNILEKQEAEDDINEYWNNLTDIE